MPKESSNHLRILSICVCALCAVGICVGTVFDFDISMALMSESDLGARIADYGLGLVDLFYAFAGTCLFVGLRQKGERYGLLAKVALGIGMSMPIIFFANDAGWNVRAMMGYVGGESSPLLALASLIPTVVVVSAVPLVFAKRLEDKDPRQAHCDGRVSHRVRHLRPVCERPAQAALLEAAAALLGHPRRALLRVQGVVADGALCRRAQRCRGKLPVQSHDARGFDVQPARHLGVVRHRSEVLDWASIGVACVYVTIMAHNRIQMGGHFLSDVCLGVLVTTCLLHLFFAAFLRPYMSGRK